jgi:hypothetical protein
MEMRASINAVLATGTLILVPGAGASLAADEAAAGAGGAAARPPDFQPYIFWAYGIACSLILLFTLWTMVQTRAVEKRLLGLEGRLQAAGRDTGRGAS